nr:MAG TPA: hypothetical protein [Caudoviricetes sp.]
MFSLNHIPSTCNWVEGYVVFFIKLKLIDILYL